MCSSVNPGDGVSLLHRRCATADWQCAFTSQRQASAGIGARDHDWAASPSKDGLVHHHWYHTGGSVGRDLRSGENFLMCDVVCP